MKKVLSLTLIFLLLLSSVPTFAFSDVSKQDWHEVYVTKAVDQKLVNGYKDGSFKPKNNVTVAEFISMAVNALEIKGHGYSVSYSFSGNSEGISVSILNPDGTGTSIGTNGSSGSDLISIDGIVQNKWYHDQIFAAKAFNLIDFDANQMSVNYFEKNITRAEMAQIINAALDVLGEKESAQLNTAVFTDKIDSKYKSSILDLYEKKIISGYSDKTFRQANPATRAEAAVMILKMVDPSYRK